VPAPSPTDRAPTEAAKAAATPEKKSEATRAETQATKLPPMKGLTLNEVRVMLGAMPVSAAAQLAGQEGMSKGSFDVYV
jgi:hypothetical protein